MISESFTPTTVTNATTMTFTPGGVLYAILFSLLILAFILIPYIIELWLAYDLARKRDEKSQEILKSSIKEYLDALKSQNGQLTEEQMDRLCKCVFVPIQETLKQPVTGVTGSTRGVIAFAVIFLVGICSTLIMFASGGDPQIVNNVISMLAATLATIVGFYFGGRGAQDAIDRADKIKAAATTPAPPPETEKRVPPAAPAPVLKVKGITIGATKKNENGAPVIVRDVDIFGFWDTYDRRHLDYRMDPGTEYSLYCNVESSVPEGSYDIYIEPVLKKEFESKPFLYDLREKYEKMIPHSSVKTWYVKNFEWFPKYQNWRAAGEYRIIFRMGYLKKGTVGREPAWQEGTEEFTVTLT